MRKTLRELAEYLEGEVVGDGTIEIRGLATIREAGEGEITFLDNQKYLPDLARTRASGVIVGPSTELPPGKSGIRVEAPYHAWALLLDLCFPAEPRPRIGISDASAIGADTVMGQDVNVWPGASIGDRTRIGDRCDIHPGVVIGPDCRIGADCVLRPNVVVYRGCQLGDRVILHAGVVIGADGFGYSFHDGTHVKVPQVGNVVIEDDVEIGANSTVDRAMIGSTRIGRGSKIDNLVMIAHNCQVGEGCIIVSQAGLSGSTRLGKFVTLAGQVGVVGHLCIGDGAKVGAQSGVTKDVAPGEVVLGSPAMPIHESKRSLVLMKYLPEMRERVKELEERIEALEAKLREGGS
ncbi:MAG: UDP-3-O-(3-hydroxymyristoyl)glucosamine N-acyltransferase [Planctomycetes bacterium]|nr:UDP-3-O-(3-hydroxymyristoyl)glucosamine N-acyltransferase [Planctomycetota bacterium]